MPDFGMNEDWTEREGAPPSANEACPFLPTKHRTDHPHMGSFKYRTETEGYA